LSRERGLSTETVVNLHSKSIYRVYMVGFLPGFAYMGKVDERIATPRKKEPVLNIPAGSVGIAGIQTGVYPVSSPGGWNIIGRTPMSMFDPRSSDPVLLRGGDRVKFIPISLDTYHGYTSH
jgi:inhibitor of KinA